MCILPTFRLWTSIVKVHSIGQWCFSSCYCEAVRSFQEMSPLVLFLLTVFTAKEPPARCFKTQTASNGSIQSSEFDANFNRQPIQDLLELAKCTICVHFYSKTQCRRMLERRNQEHCIYVSKHYRSTTPRKCRISYELSQIIVNNVKQTSAALFSLRWNSSIVYPYHLIYLASFRTFNMDSR